jgi:ribosomal protein L31E
MKILEHNVETNEVVERDMTAEEVAIETEIAKQISDKYQEIQDSKNAVLSKLGITQEEARLLLS